MNIILIGFKNCGKSSVGKLLAKKLHKNFIDTDQLLEQQYTANTKSSLTVREIYQLHGEQYFRHLEKHIIIHLNNIKNSVIATGGGSVLDSENVIHLKKIGKLIYLSISLDVLRMRTQQQLIPAFLNTQELEKSFLSIYDARKNIYSQISDIEINTENKMVETIANEIKINLSSTLR